MEVGRLYLQLKVEKINLANETTRRKTAEAKLEELRQSAMESVTKEEKADG
jgi:hypothetical protein